jgi:hypothetical protein
MRACVLLFVAMACVAAQDPLQPVTDVQVVTLTGKKPEVVAPAAPKASTKLAAAIESSSGTNVPLSPDVVPKKAPNSWYVRSKLNWACGMENCNGTEHCFGNPGGFLQDENTARPDGSHHQFCCRFPSTVIDPAEDPMKLLPAMGQCTTINPPTRSWCVAEDESGLTAGQRCELHGGKIMWNYHNGRIYPGSEPGGKCMSPDQARSMALYGNQGGDDDSAHAACIGADGTVCCGAGTCEFSPSTGRWGCAFPATYNVYECFPGRRACLGNDGTECCGHGECVFMDPTWGCVWEPGYNSAQCMVEMASKEEVDTMNTRLKEIRLKLRSMLHVLDQLADVHPNKLTRERVISTTARLESMVPHVDNAHDLHHFIADLWGLDSLAEKVNMFNVPDSELPSGGDVPKVDPSDVMQLMATWVEAFSDRVQPWDTDGQDVPQ